MWHRALMGTTKFSLRMQVLVVVGLAGTAGFAMASDAQATEGGPPPTGVAMVDVAVTPTEFHILDTITITGVCARDGIPAQSAIAFLDELAGQMVAGQLWGLTVAADGSIVTQVRIRADVTPGE
jgi:hypothetical protein